MVLLHDALKAIWNGILCFSLKKDVLNTLSSGHFWGFPKKTQTHMALRRNFSGPVSTTDLVKVSKDAASLLV